MLFQDFPGPGIFKKKILVRSKTQKTAKVGERRRNTPNYVYCRSSTDQQNSTYWINSIHRNCSSDFFSNCLCL